MKTPTTLAAASKRTKPRPDLPPILNRIDDGAARLGVSRALIYRWIKAERLRVIKLGTRTLIDECELQRVAAELVRESSAARGAREVPHAAV